jgi:twinkle protein
MIDLLAQDLASSSQFYSTALEHKDRLIEGFNRGKEPGESSGIFQLDNHFTIRKGFMYCFTGWPGSGKSEFLTQLAIIQASKKGRKTAIYSPESYPVEDFIDSVVHCYLGKTTDKRFPNVCSEAEYIQAIEFVDKFFYFLDWKETPDVFKVIEAFKFLNKKGAEFFIVDPFNSLVTDGESSNLAVAIKNNLTNFKRFTSQNKVVTCLVEHPKTPTEPKEYDNIPNNRNLFGGTMWWNKVDVGVSVHRPNRHDKNDDQVIIQTWKVKNQHLNGTPGEVIIHYDFKSRQYFGDRQRVKEPPLGFKPYYEKKDDAPF